MSEASVPSRDEILDQIRRLERKVLDAPYDRSPSHADLVINREAARRGMTRSEFLEYAGRALNDLLNGDTATGKSP